MLKVQVSPDENALIALVFNAIGGGALSDPPPPPQPDKNEKARQKHKPKNNLFMSSPFYESMIAETDISD